MIAVIVGIFGFVLLLVQFVMSLGFGFNKDIPKTIRNGMFVNAVIAVLLFVLVLVLMLMANRKSKRVF